MYSPACGLTTYKALSISEKITEQSLTSETSSDSNMRPHCIFISSLALLILCSLVQSEFSQGPSRCCFSFSSVKIPLRVVESCHTTHIGCHQSGIIIITKAGNEICADPTERWVQRLKNLVDARNLKEFSQRDTKDTTAAP